MRYLIIALLVSGCAWTNPKFLGDYHKHKPPKDKPILTSCWICEYPSYIQNQWPQGIYLEIEGKNGRPIKRLVGFYTLLDELSTGYGVNAVIKDRLEHGPLTRNQLGGQPWMHCRMVTLFIAPSEQKPIGDHMLVHSEPTLATYGRVKGYTFVGEGQSLSIIDPGDWGPEAYGEEALHQYWEGAYHTLEKGSVEYPINTVGLQPSLQGPGWRTMVPRWSGPDSSPDYLDQIWINYGDEKGKSFDEVHGRKLGEY